jgi:hypothetical protein
MAHSPFDLALPGETPRSIRVSPDVQQRDPASDILRSALGDQALAEAELKQIGGNLGAIVSGRADMVLRKVMTDRRLDEARKEFKAIAAATRHNTFRKELLVPFPELGQENPAHQVVSFEDTDPVVAGQQETERQAIPAWMGDEAKLEEAMVALLGKGIGPEEAADRPDAIPFGAVPEAVRNHPQVQEAGDIVAFPKESLDTRDRELLGVLLQANQVQQQQRRRASEQQADDPTL